MQFCLDSEKKEMEGRKGGGGERKLRKKDTRALTIILMCYAQKPEDWYLPCHAA